MKGNAEVINKLNELLAGELADIDQYFVHSQMYLDWGLTKLYERISHESEDEKEHAAKIIERILFLGGTPNMVERTPLNIGHDVPSMLKSDLALEYLSLMAYVRPWLCVKKCKTIKLEICCRCY